MNMVKIKNSIYICTIVLIISLFGVISTSNVYGATQWLAVDGTCKTGTLNGNTDEYSFYLPERGAARVGVSSTCAGVTLTLSTDAEHSNVLYKGKDKTLNLDEGYYYVQIECSDGHVCSQSYEISANFKEFNEFDAEPNDTMGEAIVMTSGTEYKGHVYSSYNDVDWYKLVLTDRSIIHFYLDSASQTTAFMFDEDGDWIDYFDGCAVGMTYPKYNVPAGTYYIQIKPAYGVDRNYVFSARVVKRPTVNKIKSVTSTAIGKAKITWTESKYAEGYLLYKEDVNTGSWSYVARIPAGKLSYIDTNAPYPGSSCIYHVCGYCYDKKDPYNPDLEILSEETNVGEKYTGTIPAPKNIKKTKYTNSIKISWGKVAGASGYKVYRKANGDSYKLVKTIKSNGTLSWNDTGVKKGTNYKYKVRAYYYAGKTFYSAYSAETSSVKLTGTIAAPGAINVKNYGAYNKVSWGKVKNATGYKVYRKVGVGTYKLVKTITSSDTLRCKDTNTKKGKKYTYKVKAYYKNYTYNSNKGKYTYKTVNSVYSKAASVKR